VRQETAARLAAEPGRHVISAAPIDPRTRDRWSRLDRAGLAVVASTLVFIVLFWRLGAPAFWDPDEAHYAETTREMLAAHDYWAPYYNDAPFFDKPMLFHQLQGAAMALVGPTELGARIVPALAALTLALVVVWLGAMLVSRDVGIVAGLLMLASPGTFALARYAILDTLFTLFLVAAAALLSVAALRDRRRLQWAGYGCIGLAVLVKGPVALVLGAVAFAAAIGASKELRRRLLTLRLVAGLGIVGLVAAPWFIHMYVRFGHAFVAGYWLDENVRLYAGSRFANQPNFWFYFRILAAGLLPWTGLLVGRAYDDLRAALRGERLDSVEILLWSWTAAVVGFFSFSTFRLDHYVFPAAPALCLLCARAWADLRADPLAPRHAGVRAGGHLVGPALVAIGIGCGYFLIERLELPRAAMVVPIVLTLGGAVLTGVVNVSGRPPRLPWVGLWALAVTYAGILVWVIPALDQRKVVDDLARQAAQEMQPGDRAATYRLDRWNPSFRFYVGRHVSFLEDRAQARAFFDAPQPFFCVMRKAAFDEFAAQGVPLRLVAEREGMWATTGRALWRSRTPTTKFVLVASTTERVVR
jgi:4-amino-4-deoxy-L-arabinose transferase-like glycosyltransferase